MSLKYWFDPLQEFLQNTHIGALQPTDPNSVIADRWFTGRKSASRDGDQSP